MVTLKSGKVYVGLLKQAFDPKEFTTSIKIHPMYSGYRNTETKKLDLCTPYSDLDSKIVERPITEIDDRDPLAVDLVKLKTGEEEPVEVDMEDVGVVILWSEIEYFSIYDPNIASTFEKKGAGDTNRTG